MVISSVKQSAEYLWKHLQVVANKVDKKKAFKVVSQYQRPILACFVVFCLAYLIKRVLNDKGYSVIDLSTGALSTVAGFTTEKTLVVAGAVLLLAKPVLKPAGNFVAPYTKGLVRLFGPDKSRPDPKEITRDFEAISDLLGNPEDMEVQAKISKALKVLRKIRPYLNKIQARQAPGFYESLLLAKPVKIAGPIVYNVIDHHIKVVPGEGDCGFESWLEGLKAQSPHLEGSVLEPTLEPTEKALPKLRKETVAKERKLFDTDGTFRNLLEVAIMDSQHQAMAKFFEDTSNAKFAATFDPSAKFEEVFQDNFDEAQQKMSKPFANIGQAREFFARYEQSVSQSDDEEGEFMHQIRVQDLCEELLKKESITATVRETYFTNMNKPKTWAQLPEHYALAHRYNLPVCIVVKPPEHADWRKERTRIMEAAIAGEEVSGQYTFIFNKDAATGGTPKPWIFIEHGEGNHYNAVLQGKSPH